METGLTEESHGKNSGFESTGDPNLPTRTTGPRQRIERQRAVGSIHLPTLEFL